MRRLATLTDPASASLYLSNKHFPGAPVDDAVSPKAGVYVDLLTLHFTQPEMTSVLAYARKG